MKGVLILFLIAVVLVAGCTTTTQPALKFARGDMVSPYDSTDRSSCLVTLGYLDYADSYILVGAGTTEAGQWILLGSKMFTVPRESMEEKGYKIGTWPGILPECPK